MNIFKEAALEIIRGQATIHSWEFYGMFVCSISAATGMNALFIYYFNMLAKLPDDFDPTRVWLMAIIGLLGCTVIMFRVSHRMSLPQK
jgi:hypothetical protein